MILTDVETNRFTKTVKYCKNYVPVFDRYIPSRYKKYLEYAGKGGSWFQTAAATVIAARALNNGNGPTLKIVETATILPDGEMANGFFWAKFPNDLYLDVENARKYEADTAKYEIALQYLVLHELIHYTRHHAGLAAELAGGAEAGDTFEKDAYGRDVSHIWNSGARPYDRGLVL